MFRRAVAALMLCLVLTVAVDPSGGSAADIQRSEDVAGSVIASSAVKVASKIAAVEHHAGLTALVTAIALCIVGASRLVPRRDDRGADRAPVRWLSAQGWRSPPVSIARA